MPNEPWWPHDRPLHCHPSGGRMTDLGLADLRTTGLRIADLLVTGPMVAA
jgi:hypothetical protein